MTCAKYICEILQIYVCVDHNSFPDSQLIPNPEIGGYSKAKYSYVEGVVMVKPAQNLSAWFVPGLYSLITKEICRESA